MTHQDLMNLLQRQVVIAKEQFWQNRMGDLTACVDETGLVVIERDGHEMLLEKLELRDMAWAMMRFKPGVPKPPKKLFSIKLFGLTLAIFG